MNAVLEAALAPGRAVRARGGHPFEVASEAGPSFVAGTALLTGADGLADRADALSRALGTERRDIGATFFAQHHAWAIAAPMAGALLLAGRVPLLVPEAVALRAIPGSASMEVACADAQVAVADADPAAGAPGTVAVGGEDGLLRALWGVVEAHMALLAPPLSAVSGRPQSGLWRVAHDATANGFVALGEACGPRERAWAAWGRARALAPRRLRGRAEPVLVGAPGGERALVARAGCCLVWRCPGRAQPCVGCPLVPAAERAGLLARLSARPAAA